MFQKAELFNPPLNRWDVSPVTDNGGYVLRTLCCCLINPWTNGDVSLVVDMSYMFSRARAFHQPLDTWDMSEITTMCHIGHVGASSRPLHDGWVCF